MAAQRFRHFLAVVEEGHFGRAAARLGIKQPPLSQSIRRLERDLGVALLERTAKGVKLTSAGEAFLPEAQAAVAAAERAAVLARAAATPRKPVRVGVVSVALWEILPGLLSAARRADIDIELEQAMTNDQLSALAAGGLDLGLVSPPFNAPARLRVAELTRERVVVALPEELAPRNGKTVALAGIADRLILFPKAEGPVLHEAIMAMFRARGLTPKIVQESPGMLTTLALVAAGVGASFVPAALARSLSMDRVAFRHVDPAEDAPAWPVALAHMPLAARSASAKLLAAWRHESLGNSSLVPSRAGERVTEA
jgi:DNA-binding transcriptional LysR family regulator